MSNALRFAVAAEGPTDLVMIESALRAIHPNVSLVITALQPVDSVAFGGFGGGWGGVYRWCKQMSKLGGGLLGAIENRFDGLVLHVDADVAGFTYASAGISPGANDLDLPCAQPCPPAADTIDRLRLVVCSWLGFASSDEVPHSVVFCTPSKSTEAWVVRILYPSDILSKAKEPECMVNPEARLVGKGKIKKKLADYQSNSSKLVTGWPVLAGDARFSEAGRFDSDVRRMGFA